MIINVILLLAVCWKHCTNITCCFRYLNVVLKISDTKSPGKPGVEAVISITYYGCCWSCLETVWSQTMKIIPVVNLCFGITTWLWYTNSSICYSEGLHFRETSEIQLPWEISLKSRTSLKIADFCFSETTVSTYKDLLFLTSFPHFLFLHNMMLNSK